MRMRFSKNKYKYNAQFSFGFGFTFLRMNSLTDKQIEKTFNWDLYRTDILKVIWWLSSFFGGVRSQVLPRVLLLAWAGIYAELTNFRQGKCLGNFFTWIYSTFLTELEVKGLTCNDPNYTTLQTILQYRKL